MADKSIKSDEERFWSYVEKSGECWTWTGFRDRGYGFFHRKGIGTRGAHRFAWIIANGEIPSGLCVMHKCDNPPCVRIDHLMLGTIQDNRRDCVEKRRNAMGNRINTSKLTLENVREIRAAGWSKPTKVLAKKFGVSRNSICNVLSGRTWAKL